MGENPSQRSSWFALAVLAVIGCLYYGSYYNYYFNLGDEGSVALIAERLSKGERPYVDVATGYGVLWYYPIVLLFKVFGVNFLVARIWFICLGFAAALFAYALSWRLTQSRVVAFSVALLVLLFPGSGYKTYIPLLVIAGAYVLFLYDARTLKPTTTPWLALAANGFYLSVAFLIRDDIATVYAALFVLYHGLIGLQMAIRERNPRRLLLFPIRLAGVVLVATIVALPFAMHAKAAGYMEGFLHQYSQAVHEIVVKFHARYLLPLEPAAEAAGAGTLLPRADLSSIFYKSDVQWVFLTYAPLLVPLLVCFYLYLDFFRRQFSAPSVADFLSDNAYLLVLAIGAFSTFPQFFVFRPDIAHLSEFIPGFLVLCGYFLFVILTRQGIPGAFGIAWRWGSCTLGMLCIAYLLSYSARYHEGLDLRRDRASRLKIDDRLDLYVNRWEYKYLDGLNAVIREASGPDDYVLCFSYCPGVNFITRRPTFQKFLYVDDSFLISRPNWLAEMREEIAARKPKVIVIWNWDLNRTRISRFSVWAAPLYRFIGETYELRARIAANDNDQSWFEVYVLK